MCNVTGRSRSKSASSTSSSSSSTSAASKSKDGSRPSSTRSRSSSSSSSSSSDTTRDDDKKKRKKSRSRSRSASPPRLGLFVKVSNLSSRPSGIHYVIAINSITMAQRSQIIRYVKIFTLSYVNTVTCIPCVYTEIMMNAML